MTLPPSTRASLLIRLRDPRDHEAWVEFVSIYEPAIYRLLRRNGLQDADTLELMQELFLALSRSIERWDLSRERGSFRGWLRRVARNLVLNFLKHRQYQPVALGGSNWERMLYELPAGEDPGTEGFDRELRRQMFRQAADQVRPDVHPSTWQAFWETAVCEESIAATATKLGMSVGAVKVAKCRVLARIRVAVKSMEGFL